VISRDHAKREIMIDD
jgi:hypothetical protein